MSTHKMFLSRNKKNIMWIPHLSVAMYALYQVVFLQQNSFQFDFMYLFIMFASMGNRNYSFMDMLDLL